MNRRGLQPGTAPLTFIESSIEFSVNVTLGNQTFPLGVDTGSGDTFVADTSFQCVDVSGNNVSISECRLANLYTPSDTFMPVPSESFNVSFGGGDAATGYVGYENVTVGGIEVKQKIGVMTRAYWEISTGVSGLLGLAFPAASTTFEGPTPSDPNLYTNSTNLDIHSTIFFSMIGQGKVPAQMFTLDLYNSELGSTLTLGGIPESSAESEFATTPIVPNKMALRGEMTDVNYLYSMDVAGVSVAGVSNMTSFTTTIDSGAKAIFVPDATAAAISKAFDPPGLFNETSGYIVNCTAKAPQFDIAIGNMSFPISPKDMIEPEPLEGNICSAVVQPNSLFAGKSLFGNPFLRNVVAVFDVGHNEMHFAPKPAGSAA